MSDTGHAGRRDTRINFEQLRDVPLEDGGQIDETLDANWAQFARRWSEVYTKGSREFYRGEQVGSEVTHKIKVRWDEALWNRLSAYGATKFRVRIGARKLNLSGPPTNDDEQDEFISFPCVEVR